MVGDCNITVKSFKVVGKDFCDKFEAIKRSLGLKNDAEVLRFLVNEFYSRIKTKAYIDADADAEVFEEVDKDA